MFINRTVHFGGRRLDRRRNFVALDGLPNPPLPRRELDQIEGVGPDLASAQTWDARADVPVNAESGAMPRCSSLYHVWYTVIVSEKPGKRVPAIFFRTEGGGEPVRDWLKVTLAAEDRKRVGHDIMTVEYGWPLGMPTCRSLEGGVHEVRTTLSENRIARVLFYIDKLGRMVLLHGFIKKTRRTLAADLSLARSNKKKHEKGLP